MTKVGKATLALVAVAVVAVAVVGGGSAAPQATLTIGWAYDGVGNMAPFDGPALATAKSHIAPINKASSTKVKLLTCNTQGNKPAIAKACARKLLAQGADVIMTTCDVDYAAPVVQESINRRQADRRGLHRHRPDGPEALRRRRVGSRSRTGTSRRTRARPWPSSRGRGAGGAQSLATDTVIVYFRNVVQAFKARWTQLGGKIVTEETYQSRRREPGVVAEHGYAAEREAGRRHRDGDRGGVRRAGPDPERPADAREQHAVPELVGGRRQLLVHAGSEDHELLLRDLRIGVRQRPGGGGQRAREEERSGDRQGGKHRGIRHRPGRDRRHPPRAQADGWQHERRCPRRADAEVQERPDDLGARELLADSCTRCTGVRTG